MRKMVLWIFATVVLSGCLWGQTQGQGTQAPAATAGTPVNATKKTPEGKGEQHHHHHHKHHHKKS
jgi:hypothetical protein